MSNTLFPIKSQPIDWKPPTLSENALQRYLADNLNRVTVKNPYDKTAVLESLFNESAGINSRLASFNEKKPAPKTFTCEYTRTFSASTRRSYISSVFFIKLRAVYCRVAILLRSWSTIDFFLEIFF